MDCGLTSKLIIESLSKAVDFLCAKTADSSWWCDFSSYVGASDEWITAYTGAALAELDEKQARDAADSAWLLLEQRATEHRLAKQRLAFGFNRRAAADADSSLWACRLAGLLNATKSPVFEETFSFVRSCVRSDGGIATFPSAESVQAMVSIPADLSVAGWTSSHPCVTAAALSLPGLDMQAMRRYLRGVQRADGSWPSYWWMEREYVTALAIEALSQSGDPQDADCVHRGVGWMRAKGDRGPAFVLALRVFAFCKSGDGDPLAVLNQLLVLQLKDGSWPSSARLRLPPPDTTYPSTRWLWETSHKGFGSVQFDTQRVFTTATVVRALNACLHR